MSTARLDAEIVRRGLAPSRERARLLIKEGKVSLPGFSTIKPATQVDETTHIIIDAIEQESWASRGAHKLLGALAHFEKKGLQVAEKRFLDAGASTGGFTDVLLRHGAREVVAVDVGRDQLIPRLQSDPRVVVIDAMNIRYLDVSDTNGLCDAMVGDLSFISLTLVLESIARVLHDEADLLPMVKPQFEVGKERLSHTGVVKDPHLRVEVTTKVAEYAQTLGLSLIDVVASPLPGPSGNAEYFLWLKKDNRKRKMELTAVERLVRKAVEEGP
ncbi:TlyA family RNA methyltransferase [Corynebacterium sp. sy039]|uniref:TlyA family RNA methyltransferase n=1 Tax=Corynebacterium sp. sy039 TaxID=2599641 RepID=UPI0011B5352D|nr:TlyA family RNA methyltransferase [Corynebacterium sp. sy039]QDZ42556.1 TlyA family RNA methyltransferase [Corynebacterium sp. sy039]